MWKAAFCAAFQARRAERGMPFQIPLLRPPSAISTTNCRIFGIFLGFSPSNGRWEPNVGVSKTPAERVFLQTLVQSRFEIPGTFMKAPSISLKIFALLFVLIAPEFLSGQ